MEGLELVQSRWDESLNSNRCIEEQYLSSQI